MHVINGVSTAITVVVEEAHDQGSHGERCQRRVRDGEQSCQRVSLRSGCRKQSLPGKLVLPKTITVEQVESGGL